MRENPGGGYMAEPRPEFDCFSSTSAGVWDEVPNLVQLSPYGG